MAGKKIDTTPVKFVLVGVVNTIVGTSVMFIMYNVFSFNYWISSAANYVVGSIVSYFLNKYFTFQDKEKSWKTVVRFVLNISVCYLIAYGLARPLVRMALGGFSQTIQENIAMLAGMCLFVVVNYIGQRFFVFNNSSQKEEK
ncbi:MAG TPA: GtrA family protein [Candidatus Bariatricus faecipullorum]|nr:GtrA family protein [Candidatus Bariatricus faecipullorum]